ncbi:MAG: tetratricopeptide repeat protein [Armatimonadetes bacterium]|nr:tetratricopeptide repeat protein [Armatimonadota bacterium]
MQQDAQLVPELLDIPGVAAAEVASPCRDKNSNTTKQSREYGLRCMAEGDYEGAVSQFRNAIDQNEGDDQNLLLELGAAYESAGMAPQAYRQYMRAAKIGETGELHMGLSALDRQYGRAEAALAHLRKATEIEPANAYCHFRLAEGLRSAGNKKLALEAAARAVESEPDDPFYRYWLGDLLLQMSRFDDAVRALAAAIELSPADDTLHQLSALALWGSGKPKQAIRAVRLASDLDSENRVNYALLEAFLRMSGMEDDADQETERAAEMDAYDKDLLRRLLSIVGLVPS